LIGAALHTGLILQGNHGSTVTGGEGLGHGSRVRDVGTLGRASLELGSWPYPGAGDGHGRRRTEQESRH
jgi:hypothetical protein